MDDWAKISLGTIAGFVTGLATEPVKLYFKKRHDVSNLEHSVYREMTNNFQNLIALLQTTNANTGFDINQTQFHYAGSRHRYDEAVKDLRFDQLKHVNTIIRIYRDFEVLRQNDWRDGGEEIADALVKNICHLIMTDQLNRTLVFNFLDARI